MLKRLFVGIEAQEQALYDSAMAIRERLPGKYHPLANYHVTLAFIGCFNEEPVREALKGISPQGPVILETLPQPGFFKEGKKAVLYAPVKPDDRLGMLAYQVCQSLKRAGIPFDEREVFTPHITLARGVDSAAWDGQQLETVGFEAKEFCLFESRSGEKGLAYIPLERFLT